MATYKVIQDIEAEDKLLGPLSLRQFIYAVIVVVLGFVMFRLFMVQPLLAVPFLLPAILFGVLAAPFGHDQSSEIWLLAKIRFFIKPRVRIWDQTGLQELVKITVPKKIEQVLTDGLDQTQVKSRLQALAQTIDTRGWAVKGVDVNMYTNPLQTGQSSDRLVSAETLAPTSVPDIAIDSTDDILDTQNNPVAQQMNQLVQANDQAHRQAIMDHMQQIRNAQQQQVAAAQPQAQPQPIAQPAAAPMPSLPPIPTATAPAPTIIAPSPVPQAAPAPQSYAAAYGQTHVLQPTAPAPAPAAAPNPPAAPVTDQGKPAILKLASNDDLSVATIARQANKPTSLGDDEVVISLR